MRYITLALAVAKVYGDACTDLDRSLELHASSYSKGSVCQALFWQGGRGSGRVCFHSTRTKEVCPATDAVTVEEAAALTRKPVVATAAAEPAREPAPVVATPPMSSSRRTPAATAESGSVHIVAMGDCGLSAGKLAPTLAVLNDDYMDRDAVFLLGDLFYPLGLDSDLGAGDPRLRRLADAMSGTSPAPLYPVLGNHDRLGDWDALVKYSRVDSRWVMPAPYYTQRIVSGGVAVCTWFLDTDQRLFDERQEAWLRRSLADATPGMCDWKVVAGHHFIFSGGEYHDNAWLIAHLLPVLDEFHVDLYLAGHEHQSQVLQTPAHRPVFLVAGALGDMRDKPNRGHEFLRYINKKDVAFLDLIFFKDEIRYKFVKTYDPHPGSVIHAGVIERSTARG